jgi:uncharacterized protein (DUF1684 family)
MKLKLISLLILIALVATASNNPIDSAYQQSFDKWKAEQVNDLKTNWLVLAGLFWLKPGDNSFGSDSASAILFPKGPAHAGVFTLQGEDVTAKFSPDAHAVIDGKPATNQTLLPDSSGKRTIVEMGSLRFYLIKRGARLGIRLKDLDSEAARNFHDLVFFPLDLNYRVTAKWVPSDGKKTVDVPTVLGDVNPTPVTGTAVFTLNGQQFQLTDLGGDPSKGLFIVFNDLTSKTETYPGGRFLDTDPVVNGTVVLDFNRAYNPPCAVTPYATCPLAPKENRLTIALPVGEKYDHAHAHH